MSLYQFQLMALRKRLDRLTEANPGIERGMAMDQLSYECLYQGSTAVDFERDLVDGGDDKGIDIIRIDDDPHNRRATLHIGQVKCNAGWEANVVTLLTDGLRFVITRKQFEVDQLKNAKLRSKIKEIRALWNAYTPGHLHFRIWLVTQGNPSDIPHDYKHQIQVMRSEFHRQGFAEFEVTTIGAGELYRKMVELEERGRQINVDIPVERDQRDQPSLINYSSGSLRGVVFTASGSAIAELVKEWPKRIFQRDIRPYQGNENVVNRKILQTCSDPAISGQFWFMNNGITIVCDHFASVDLPDRTVVRVENLQVVNGCQTSSALCKAMVDEKLTAGTKVLVRVLEAASSQLVDDVAFSTNNQTAVTSRDLRSNHEAHQVLQRVFRERYAINYERRPNEFAGENAQVGPVVSNKDIGQAYLAVRLMQPSLASLDDEAVFSPKYHEKAFAEASLAHLYFTWAVVNETVRRLSRAGHSDSGISAEATTLVEHGAYHIARVFGVLIMGRSAKWPDDIAEQKAHALRIKPDDFNDLFSDAYNAVVNVLQSRPPGYDVVAYLRSANIYGPLAAASKKLTSGLTTLSK